MTMPSPIAALVLAVMLTSTTAQADDRQTVIDAFLKAFESKEYRVILRNIEGTGQEAVVDISLPDKFHMRSTQGEFIVHPSGTWARQGEQWTQLPMDMTSMMQAYQAPSKEQAEASIGAVELVGEEVVEGCPSRTYRYRSDSQEFGSGSQGEDVLLSICEKTGLPIRMKLVGNPGSLYYDFEAAIDIKPPR